MNVRVEKAPSRFPAGQVPVIAAAAVWAGLTALLMFLPRGACAPAVCPMKRLFGIPCPTCGATRAALLLLHGDPAGAFRMNPLVFVGGTVLGALLLLRIGAGRSVRIDLTPGERTGAWILFSVLLLANWVYVLACGR